MTLPIPAEVLAHPLLDEAAWIALRDSGIEPLDRSDYATTYESRAAFLIGAWLLDRSVKGGLLGNVKFQMLQEVDVLEGGRQAGKLRAAVIEPRRSAKTTTLWCVLLGRCWLEDMHQAGYTVLTTFKKAAERYRIDVYGPITAKWPDPETRPVKVYKGNGMERVEFENQSLLAILSPDGDAFRSGAYDTLVADEGGEASPEMGEDITSAVLPTFDTRPDGQFVVAGTAARYRVGNILYDTLNEPKAARLRYTVRDDTTDEELEAWEPDDEHPEARVKALVEGMHPGVVSGLTTLDKIGENYEGLKLEQFALEYLGLFGLVGESTSMFDLQAWERTGSGAALPTPPERFSLAFVAHPDQLSGSILAAWRDANGKAVPLLLEHKKGIDWIAPAVLKLSRTYQVPIVYDAGSQNALLVAEQLNRTRPRPRLEPQTFTQVKKGASLIVDLVARGEVEHYRQPELDAAIKLSVKRKAGANGWALGRPEADADITPAEAWSLAQLHYDEGKPKQARRVAKVRT